MSADLPIFRCIRRQQETYDVVSWQFVPLNGDLPATLAGQCVTMHTMMDGKELCRAYTLSSSPQDPFWQVTIKAAGAVSQYLLQNLHEGAQVALDGPFGDFHLTKHPSARPLLLSAGSGITPMWSIVRDELAKNPQADIRFIHSARSRQDLIFAPELELLAKSHRGLHHAWVLEECEAEHPWQGRLTAAMLLELAPDLLTRDVYLCGPTAYMAAVRALLAELGLPASQLHQESFGDLAPKAETAAAASFALTISKSGKVVSIAAGQTLLDALEAAGETMPAACRAGVCGACRCTTSGAIERLSDMTLSEQDLQNGVALACSCIAKGDVSIDF
ncbi:MAG: 2Fe-2S iron-sulfur cluster-binding protein [Vibrionaceae bacterium]